MDIDRERMDDSSAYVGRRESGKPDAWTELAGSAGSQRLREVRELAPPAEVADALGLPEGGLAVVRRRMMLLAERPVELTDSYYPSSFAKGTPLAETSKIPGGSPHALADLGFVPFESLEDVSVRPATEAEAELLALDAGAPVLVVFRIVLSAEGNPYEVSIMTMIPEGRHLRYRVRVERT
ncbi:UTRA domain-containing protein [Murinocardiopsis flavida]|uniref:UTRA domain-containing protein n=1 Tax=Murinocardiopsis flavida TaxID=645275 RepID=A0A2P8DPG3_9ACTN|nr:UTRA domain-containing protein [Murinocardiopsis flavida]PSK99098.1 UTRA domain-containing protein [Murinocardiopsis flavida]